MNAPADIPSRSALPDWPRLMSEPLAARYLSISPTTLRQAGVAQRRHGRRVLYDRRDLDRWADRLGDQPLDAAQEREESAAIERAFMERRRGTN